MSKIVEKQYCRIEFCLESPLSLGSGKNQKTDADLMLDSRGLPLIPATSIAGVVREMFGDRTEELFGAASDSGSGKTAESRIVFYDAHLKDPKTYFTGVRDQVRLDDWRTAVSGAKFDMEILEPGVTFVTVVEQNLHEGDRPLLEEVLNCFCSGDMAFGRKTTRGYGKIRGLRYATRSFRFSEPQDVEAWLSFDMYDADSWGDIKTCEKAGGGADRFASLELCLKQDGAISIRRYSTATADKNGAPAPDFEQLSSKSLSGGEIPVIPGTGWAGTFRHHMETIAPGSTGFTRELDEEKSVRDSYFGTVTEHYRSRSLVSFSESAITGGTGKVLTRTSVDRFTGGALDSALFTEKTVFNGETSLRISLRREEGTEYSEEFLKALSASVADLHLGLLTVGGLSSVGRGHFRVTAVNGCPFTGEAEELYSKVLNALKSELGSFTEEE